MDTRACPGLGTEGLGNLGESSEAMEKALRTVQETQPLAFPAEQR
jgi:hypothetical protein